jgi:hypothetical protein
MENPFLWKFITNSKVTKSQSGGEERIQTASLAEESKNAIAEFS